MRISNIVQLSIKELRGLQRDPLLIALIIFAFSVTIYISARSLPDTLNVAPIAIVDEDQSPLSTRIVSAFYPPYFTQPKLITTTEMDQLMDSGDITFALDIPPNFERDLFAGRSPRIQLNIDATRMTQAFSGNSYIQNIVTSEINEFVNRYRTDVNEFADRYHTQKAPLIDLLLHIRFNSNLTKSWFGAIVNLIDTITIISISLTGAALIREREHGTIEHLLVMPITPFEIMTSKICSMGLVVLIVTALSITLVIQGILAVPIAGSILLFMVGTAFHLCATCSMGIWLATVAESMPQFGMLLMLILLPMQILSGGVTPRESMPDIIQNIMFFAPTTHFVILAQQIIYRGAGINVVLPQFLALIGIGAAFFTFSFWQFRRFLK